MKILSLDMATKTGWACNDPEVSGVEDFAVRRGESPGMRFVRFRAWLQEIISHLTPDVVVYEQAHHRGGAATEVGVGLSTHMQGVLAESGIDYIGCHTGTLKRHATGKGNSKKPAMMEAYRKKWGCEPQDDNECDARWLLDWAMKELGNRR